MVLEATYGWYWAADTLAAAGAEVHLAHPLGVKAFSYRRVKNDERDAADLADLLRMGRLPEAWIAPHEVRELRELTRYRIKLVACGPAARTRSTAVLAKLGVPVTCSRHLRHGRVGVAGQPARCRSRTRARWPRCGTWPASSTTEITMLGQVIAEPARRSPRLPGYPAAARHRPGARPR